MDGEAKVKHLPQDHTESGFEPRQSGCQVNAPSITLCLTVLRGPSAERADRGQISFNSKVGVNSVRLRNRVKRIERKEIKDFERNREQVDWTLTVMTRTEHKNNNYVATLNPFLKIASR